MKELSIYSIFYKRIIWKQCDISYYIFQDVKYEVFGVTLLFGDICGFEGNGADKCCWSWLCVFQTCAWKSG